MPDTMLFDSGSRGEYDKIFAQIEQGKPATTEIGRRTITINSLFKVGASFIADGTLITSDQNFLRVFPRQEPGAVNLALIQLQPGYDPKASRNCLKIPPSR
jgi:putative ABC transport system permease protein